MCAPRGACNFRHIWHFAIRQAFPFSLTLFHARAHTLTMKRWIPWMAAAIVVVLLGGGVWRAMAARRAQQRVLAEASTQRA